MFPQRRDDGTFSVAIRYHLLAADPEAVRRVLADWLAKKADVEKEFATLPHMDVDESGDILVVFDGLSTSRLWKGLMVEAARAMESIDGATYVGFWDLVTGRPHPASVRGE